MKSDKPAEASRVAVAYVQLVYGKQLQKEADERSSSDPLDVASMSREERDRLKRELMRANPEAAQALGIRAVE